MGRPLRVAVVARAVTPLHGFGGLERSVHDLVRHLASRGVEVTLIVPPRTRYGASPDDPFASSTITLRHVSYVTFPFANRKGTTVLDRSTAYPLFGLRAGRLARDLVRKGAVDVVHGFGAAVLGYALERHRSAPLVFNPQGLEEFGATSASQPILKRVGYWPLRRAVLTCAKAADAILATDAALVPTVERHLRPRAGQVHTIPNGIDLASAIALAGPVNGTTVRQRRGVSPGEFVLLSVGRLEFNKGFDVLAAALGQAARSNRLPASAWRWVIVGDGPFRPDLQRAIQTHGIASRVILAGRSSESDLHAWYEAATLFVHPTRYEGSSLVTLEAMAHRKAIVATRAGGLPDKVRPGVNGWLVEPGDADGLARAIDEAAADLPALEAMGAKSRSIVEHEFNWDVLVDRQIALYEALLSR